MCSSADASFTGGRGEGEVKMEIGVDRGSKMGRGDRRGEDGDRQGGREEGGGRDY